MYKVILSKCPIIAIQCDSSLPPSLSLFLLTLSFLLLSRAIIENVRDHRESLDSIESSQKELSHQLVR